MMSLPSVNETIMEPLQELTYLEREKRDRSERVKRGMALKAAAGFHMHRVPVGYHRAFQDNKIVIEPDPFQAPLVHQAFLLAATGEHSLRKLLAIMTESGLRTVSGKPMSISGFHAMLSNPFYAGTVRSGGISFPGAHRALVSRATFDRLNADALKPAEGSVKP